MMINNPGNKPTALFICNEKFLDSSLPEGGVKFCTDEFSELIKVKFEVINFPVKYTNTLAYRISKKLGTAVYNDYEPSAYAAALKKTMEENNTRHAFLNLTNTAPFAEVIKHIDPEVKVILCSHGNESGDYLHEVSTHAKYAGARKRLAARTLGKMLVKEAEMRSHIDLVLTVSDVEEGIEKWLGAKRIYMVPRFISKQQIPYHPVVGRVGFLSDLSHEPNYFGIKEVCNALQKSGNTAVEIRLAGGGKERGAALAQQFSFVHYLGYLPEAALEKEIASWSFSLNPVFYYSRGVSTKLGKSLGMGLPVITTDKGMRGYKWKTGEIPVASDAEQMASMIIDLSHNKEKQQYYHQQVLQIQQSAPSYADMMADIQSFL